MSRKEAKEQGLERYFTGKPCKNGHISERYTSGHCVSCKKERGASREAKEYKRSYREKNKETIRKKRKSYNSKNRKYISEYMKDYNSKNKEAVNKRRREYYAKNKDTLLEKRREWEDRNKEHRRKYHNEYVKNKYKNNRDFKTSVVCKSMLRRVLKATGSKKINKTHKILGYSSKDLKESIQSKFLDSMSWDNYGEWHIDHIYPISRYIDDGVKDPAVINSLRNLIPMWDEHNWSKSSQTLEEFLDNNPELIYLYGHFLDVNKEYDK